MNDYTQIPQINIPMVDPKTGILTPEWIRFFLTMMNRTGGTVPDTPSDAAVQAMLTDTSDQGSVVTKQKDRSLLWAIPSIGEGDTSRSFASISVTVGASPYDYVAASEGMLFVSGGGVSSMSFSRDGSTFYPTGSFYGAFPLRKGDTMRITYSVAPTVTFVPM